jgi:LytS/YehU family sensor histidine kinase
MDAGEVVYIISTLSTGALAAFFAIMLWSKTRDIAWMLMVIGTIVAYVETVYSILNLFGVAAPLFSLGSMSLTAILLPNLRMGFFAAALVVMVVRKLQNR